jgi:hypothetical protein
VQLSELLEILFDISLSTEYTVDFNSPFICGPKEGGFMRAYRPTGCYSSSIVASHYLELLRIITGEGGSHGMNLISPQEDTLKLVEHEF